MSSTIRNLRRKYYIVCLSSVFIFLGFADQSKAEEKAIDQVSQINKAFSYDIGLEKHKINEMAWSQDGSFFAIDIVFQKGGTSQFKTYKKEPATYVWDANDFKKISRLDPVKHDVSRLIFTSDNSKIIAMGLDHKQVRGKVVKTYLFKTSLSVWEVATGKLIKTMQLPEDRTSYASTLSIMPDDSAVIYKGVKGLKIVDLKTFEISLFVDANDIRRNYSSLFFSKKTNQFIGESGKTVAFIDAKTKKFQKYIKPHSNMIERLLPSPDENFFFTYGYEFIPIILPNGEVSHSGSEESLRIWDIKTLQMSHEKKGPVSTNNDAHDFFVESISPDGKLGLFYHKADGYRLTEAFVWDFDREDFVFRFPVLGVGRYSEVSTTNFSPNNHRILLGSENGQFEVWDIPDADKLKPIKTPQIVPGLKKKSFQTKVFTGSAKEKVRLRLSPNDKFVIVFKRSSFQVINLENSKLIREHSIIPQACSVISSDGRSIYSGGTTGSVMMWDVDSGLNLKSFEGVGIGHRILAIAVNEQNSRLAALDSNEKIHVWDIESGKEKIDLYFPIEKVDSFTEAHIHFAGNGGILLASVDGSDPKIHAFDVRIGGLIKPFDNSLDKHDIKFMPIPGTSQCVVHANRQFARAKRYDFKIGRVMGSYLYKPDPVIPLFSRSFTISPKSEMLATWYDKGRVNFFDLSNFKHLKIYQADHDEIDDVVITRSGKKAIFACRALELPTVNGKSVLNIYQWNLKDLKK